MFFSVSCDWEVLEEILKADRQDSLAFDPNLSPE